MGGFERLKELERLERLEGWRVGGFRGYDC